MRKIALLFALLSLSAFCGSPADWYTPPNFKFINDTLEGVYTFGYESYMVKVDADGNITWMGEDENGSYENPYVDPDIMFAIEYAMTAKLMALRNEEKIKRLGETLTSVFMTQGFKTEFGGTSYTLRIPQNALTEAAKKKEPIQLEGEKLWDDISGKVDEQTITRVDKKLTLKNKPLSKASVAKMAGGVLVWEDLDPYLVISNDHQSLEVNDEGNWEIKGWSKASPPTNYTLGEVLNGSMKDGVGVSEQQKNHIITRSASGTLNFVEIGKIATNAPVVVDEKSITKITETGEDGKETTKLALMGFDASPATEGIDASSVFPYKASNKLVWSPLFSFFSDGIFKKNSKNQISLKGLDTIGEGTKIVTATANGAEPQLGASDIKDMVDKPLAVENKKITIEGWSANKDGNLFDSSGCEVVVRDNGKMKFKTFGGADGSSVNLTDDGKLQLKDWKTANPCSESVSKMLTNPNDPNRDTHHFLAKVGNNLHYVSIGEVIPTNAVAEVDEVSITKTTNDDGKEVLSLYGFGNGGTETNPYIPSEIDGLLSWKSIIDYFNGNMFDLKDGKITLKGLDGDDEEIRILTVKGGDNGAAITSNSMKTFIDPPLEWRDNKITVAGYNVADDNTYLKKTQTGVEWAKVDKGLLADEKAVTTNAAPFEAFTLVGFGDAKENDIPFKDSTKLNWQPITDFLDTTVDNKSIVLNDSDKLAVKGAETVSSPKKYFGTGTATSVIGWYDLPNVTTNRIDADEVTLTTDNSADGKLKTVRWKTTPSEKASLARMGGDGIEWIPFDSVTNNFNAIVGVDNVSVETNENGKLQIKGWNQETVCEEDMYDLLTSANGTHEVLCRYNGDSLHYVPIARALSDLLVDGDTLVEKGDGTICLAGSYGVEPGTVPHRTENGLEWKKPNGDIEVDEPLIKEEGTDGSTKIKLDEDYLEELKCKCDIHTRPIADGYTIIEKEDGVWSVSEDFVGSEAMTNAIDEAINEAVSKPDGLTIIENEDDGYFSLVGSYEAEPNTMLVKDEDGNYVWMPVDNFLNDDIDGDTIIGKGDGTIGLAGSFDAEEGSVPTRSANGLDWIAPQTMEVLTDIEWDDSTKTFKKTYKTIEFYGKVVETE